MVTSLAWSGVGEPWRTILYHFVFALGICIMFPTWYMVTTGRTLGDIGLSLKGFRWNALVGVLAVCVTVPWRLGPVTIPDLMTVIVLVAAMSFSTLFEEVFFRGFLQTRAEAVLGPIPAIGCSALAFALYHLGYGPEWWHVQTMIKMVLVGIMFGVAFQLTRNIATSFILNLPHAVVTFLERREYFGPRAAITSLTVVALASVWLTIMSVRRGSIVAPERCDSHTTREQPG